MRSSYFPARLAPEKGLSKLKRRYQSVFTPGFTSFRISPREITIRRRITPKRGGFLDYPRSYYHDSYYVNYYHRFCDDKAMRSERRKMTGSARDRTSQRHVDLWATTPMSEVVFPILKTLKYNWPTRRDKGKRVVRRSRSDRLTILSIRIHLAWKLYDSRDLLRKNVWTKLFGLPIQRFICFEWAVCVEKYFH